MNDNTGPDTLTQLVTTEPLKPSEASDLQRKLEIQDCFGNLAQTVSSIINYRKRESTEKSIKFETAASESIRTLTQSLQRHLERFTEKQQVLIQMYCELASQALTSDVQDFEKSWKTSYHECNEFVRPEMQIANSINNIYLGQGNLTPPL